MKKGSRERRKTYSTATPNNQSICFRFLFVRELLNPQNSTPGRRQQASASRTPFQCSSTALRTILLKARHGHFIRKIAVTFSARGIAKIWKISNKRRTFLGLPLRKRFNSCSCAFLLTAKGNNWTRETIENMAAAEDLFQANGGFHASAYHAVRTNSYDEVLSANELEINRSLFFFFLS